MGLYIGYMLCTIVQSGATPSWKVLWPDMPHAIYPMHMLVFNAWTFG